MPEKAKGVIPAALTAFNRDLSLDVPGTIAHYRWLLENGCHGILSQGTTGEANSIGLTERLVLMEAIGEAGLADKTVVGTGTPALPDSIELTRMAVEIGAAGVLVLPPYYFKGVTQDGLFAAFAQLIERVGDERLKVYLYHFPKMTAIDLSLEVIGRLISAFPGIVVGLKNSSGDWDSIKAMIEAFPGFDVFPGSEDFLLPAMQMGSPGCMSASVNLLFAKTRILFDDPKSSEAENRQAKLRELRAILTQSGAIPAFKATLGTLTGKEERWATVRPPLVALDPGSGQRILDQLRSAGY